MYVYYVALGVFKPATLSGLAVAFRFPTNKNGRKYKNKLEAYFRAHSGTMQYMDKTQKPAKEPITNDSTVANSNTSITEPVVSEHAPTAMPPQALEPSPKDGMSLVKKILLTLRLVLVVMVLVVIFIVASFFYSMNQKMDTLQAEAKAKASTLSSLLVLNNQTAVAKAVVNGSWRTASENPAESTHAEATITASGSLPKVESQVDTTLSKKGFKRDGPAATTPYYYASPAMSSPTTFLTLRYIRGDSTVKVSYRLDKSYLCPSDKVCVHTAQTKDVSKVYDVRSYANAQVIRLDVVYADKNHYMATIY